MPEHLGRLAKEYGTLPGQVKYATKKRKGSNDAIVYRLLFSFLNMLVDD